MSSSERSVLQKYIGEVVIVLPDLHDPLADESQITSDADVRFMGILADADQSMIELHPYALLTRKSDVDREKEIATTLDPTLETAETGLKARMTQGAALPAAGGKTRSGTLIKTPLLIPISQCDSIRVYRATEPGQRP